MTGVKWCAAMSMFIMLCILTASSPGRAALIQLPNRAAWDEAVAELGLRTVSEDFDSVPVQVFPPDTTSQVGRVRMTHSESESAEIRGENDHYFFALLPGDVAFEFPAPVFAFAADLAKLREQDPTRILVGEEVLSATAITDSPGTLPDFDYFVGVVSDTPIRGFSFGNTGFGFGMDNLIFAPIPEPSASLLFGIGALVFGSAGRRRRSAEHAVK